MILRLSRYGFMSAFATALVFSAPSRGEDARAKSIGAKETTAKQTPTTPSRSGARGPLPDPVLLDGSTLPAENRPEQGMVGDFELPGDQNARNSKVGGPQGPQGSPQASAGDQQTPQGTMDGGASSEQSQQAQGSGPQGAQTSAGGAQAASRGAQGTPGGPTGPAGGPSDPNASADGMQVSQLEGDPSAGGDGQPMSAAASKPQPVTIGDKAMQIKSAPNAQSAVGATAPAGATQQMESKMGGGRGSSSVSGGRNAAEKGRAMPAGL